MISSKAEEYLCCGLKVVSNKGIKYFQNKNLSYMSDISRKDIANKFKNEFSLDRVLSKYDAIYQNFL